MNRIVMLGVAGALVGAAGCGPATGPGGGGGGGGGGPIISFQDDEMLSRFIAVETDASGDAVARVDRSRDEQPMTVRQRFVDGVLADASVFVDDEMGGGTPVPGDDNLPVDPTSLGDRIPTFESADSFLGEVREGDNYVITTYRTQLGDRRFTGYGVTGSETAFMPSSGTATYNGRVNGTAFGSQTGEQALAGDVSLGANFGPGLATIGGRMDNLRLINGPDDFPLGSDVVMNATTINGSSYRNGTMQLVNPGTNTANSIMSSSGYDGAFYGGSARETAGTFQFDALGAPIVDEFGTPTGATERLEAVGAYGARR